MFHRKPRNPKTVLTFWAVLSCGIVAGAAVASSHVSPSPDVDLHVETKTASTVAPVPATSARPSSSHFADTQATTLSAPPIGVANASPAEPAQEPMEEATATKASRLRPAAPAAASTPPELAPRRAGPSIIWLVLALACGAGVFLWRRRRRDVGSSDPRCLELVDTVKLGNRWEVSLVRAPGRMLVIGATDREVSLLADLSPDEPIDLGSVACEAVSAQAAEDDDAPPVETPGTPGSREEDPFLDALLGQLAAQPAVIRTPSQTHEKTDLRRRLRDLQQTNASL